MMQRKLLMKPCFKKLLSDFKKLLQGFKKLLQRKLLPKRRLRAIVYWHQLRDMTMES